MKMVTKETDLTYAVEGARRQESHSFYHWK